MPKGLNPLLMSDVGTAGVWGLEVVGLFGARSLGGGVRLAPSEQSLKTIDSKCELDRVSVKPPPHEEMFARYTFLD